MGNQEDLIIYKINIEPEINKAIEELTGYQWMPDQPYFFVKISEKEKRYRISASFEFINKKWGLKIGIIRDIFKIKKLKIFKEKKEGDEYLIDFANNELYSNLAISIDEEVLSAELSYKRFFDPINETFIFIVTRMFNNTVNQSVVFFSKSSWSLTEYMQKIKKNL